MVPVSASVRNSARLLNPTAAPDGTLMGTPYLADRVTSGGFTLRAAFLLSNFEIGYGFERMGWATERRRCHSTEQATMLPNGQVDDAAINYECGPVERVDISDDDWKYLSLHTLNAALRLETRWPRNGALFGLAGPGLALTRHHDTSSSQRLRAGFRGTVGGGYDLDLDRWFTLTAALRYCVTMFGSEDPLADSANRAVAAGTSPATAVLDTSHMLLFSLGVRINFR